MSDEADAVGAAAQLGTCGQQHRPHPRRADGVPARLPGGRPRARQRAWRLRLRPVHDADRLLGAGVGDRRPGVQPSVHARGGAQPEGARRLPRHAAGRQDRARRGGRGRHGDRARLRRRSAFAHPARCSPPRRDRLREPAAQHLLRGRPGGVRRHRDHRRDRHPGRPHPVRRPTSLRRELLRLGLHGIFLFTIVYSLVVIRVVPPGTRAAGPGRAARAPLAPSGAAFCLHVLSHQPLLPGRRADPPALPFVRRGRLVHARVQAVRGAAVRPARHPGRRLSAAGRVLRQRSWRGCSLRTSDSSRCWSCWVGR